MLSIKTVFRIGNGPSSSHTIGPVRICEYVLNTFGEGAYDVELLGSLALTGKGHFTDVAIKKVLGNDTNVIFNKTFKGIDHPNTMRIYKKGEKTPIVTAISSGGGNIIVNGVDLDKNDDIYKEKNFDFIPEEAMVTKDDAIKNGWKQNAEALSNAYRTRLSEMTEVNIEDPKWESFLNEFTYKELEDILTMNVFSHSDTLDKIGVEGISEKDGPAMFGIIWWPSAPIIAATLTL